MTKLSREQLSSTRAQRTRLLQDLVDFMVSGPVMIQALEGENAVLATVT